MSAFFSFFRRLGLLGLFLISLSSEGDEKNFNTSAMNIYDQSYLFLIEDTLNEIDKLLGQGEFVTNQASQSQEGEGSEDMLFLMGIDPLSGSNIFEILIQRIELLLKYEKVEHLSMSPLLDENKSLKERIIRVITSMLQNQRECESLTHEIESWSLRLPVESNPENDLSLRPHPLSRFVLILEESIKSCSNTNDQTRRQRGSRDRGRSELGVIDCDDIALKLFKSRYRTLVGLKREADRRSCIRDYNQFRLLFDLI